jgi:hypothetical protein
MFYDGKLYPVKRAEKPLITAIKEYVAREVGNVTRPLEQYEAVKAAMESLPVVRFMVKHLVPTFSGEVTEENREIFYRAINIHHLDPVRANVLQIRDARRWEKAKEKSSDVTTGGDHGTP